MAKEAEYQAEDLRRELYGLARAERELRREIGRRVLDSHPMEDLRIRRRENRERQEDLAAAVGLLEALVP